MNSFTKVIIVIIIICLIGLFLLYINNEQPVSSLQRLFAGAPSPPTAPTTPLAKTIAEDPKIVTRTDERYVLDLLPDPNAQGKCLDIRFPVYNPKIKKCMQCDPLSFNCLTGYQHCNGGFCRVKNSPQCAFFPFMND